MKLLEIPTGEKKPSWAALFGSVSMVYLFIDAYASGTSVAGWILAAIAFLLAFGTYAVGVIHWANRRVVAVVCALVVVVSAAYTSYRGVGIILFAYAAALAPFAVNGHVGRCVAINIGIAALMLIEWWILWPPSYFPLVFAAVSMVLGAATTVVVRQQSAMRRIHKTAERERIARDLHDVLGHTLTVITLKAELAGKLISNDPSRAQTEITDVERISRQALADVRAVISGYHAGDLHTELQHTRSLLQTADISLEVDIDLGAIPAAHERVLTLVLREAVTNLIRHASAKRCWLSLTTFADHVRMRIKDDGVGGSHQEGMGMRGIRDRAESIGGEVAWQSSGGTELIVTIPLGSRGDEGRRA